MRGKFLRGLPCPLQNSWLKFLWRECLRVIRLRQLTFLQLLHYYLFLPYSWRKLDILSAKQNRHIFNTNISKILCTFHYWATTGRWRRVSAYTEATVSFLEVIYKVSIKVKCILYRSYTRNDQGGSGTSTSPLYPSLSPSPLHPRDFIRRPIVSR